MLEFSDGSNGTAELNCQAIQAAPVGAQLGTASMDSWTTGTECKTISFQQVSLCTSKYTSCITSSVVSSNLCIWQPVVKIYFLEVVYTKAIRFNNPFLDFAIIVDKCISYILMQYCQPHHIFYSKQFRKPPYAIIFQSFQSASFSVGIYSSPITEFDVWRRAILKLDCFLTLRNPALHCLIKRTHVCP